MNKEQKLILKNCQLNTEIAMKIIDIEQLKLENDILKRENIILRLKTEKKK